MTRHVLTTGAPLPQTLAVLLAAAAAAGCNAPSPEPPPSEATSQPPTTESGEAPASVSGVGQTGQGNAGSPLTAHVSDLDALVDELDARVTDQEIIVPLPADVLFDFDQSDIRPEAIPTLQTLVRLIASAGSGPIRVEGHTDSKGDDAYNQTLSEQRAASVGAWLSSHGIARNRLRTSGRGETQPIANNETPDGSDNPQGRQENRRVEVVISNR